MGQFLPIKNRCKEFDPVLWRFLTLAVEIFLSLKNLECQLLLPMP